MMRTTCQFSDLAFYVMTGAWVFTFLAFVFCAVRRNRKHGP